MGDAFFAEQKPPEGTATASTRGLEASNHPVWSHPITLRSLVVWSTDVGPKIKQFMLLLILFHQFSKTQFAPQSSISMIWSCRSVLPLQNRDAHLFHIEKTRIFMISIDFTNCVVLGPRPLGPMGPSIF